MWNIFTEHVVELFILVSIYMVEPDPLPNQKFDFQDFWTQEQKLENPPLPTCESKPNSYGKIFTFSKTNCLLLYESQKILYPNFASGY